MLILSQTTEAQRHKEPSWGLVPIAAMLMRMEMQLSGFGVKKEDTILLAEDSEDDLVLMRYAFQQAGVLNQVHEVHDAQEAINYLESAGRYSDRERYPLPCVIITDVKMPYDGMTFLHWLRSKPEFQRVPKLVLSNSGADVDRSQAVELGAIRLLHKTDGP